MNENSMSVNKCKAHVWQYESNKYEHSSKF